MRHRLRRHRLRNRLRHRLRRHRLPRHGLARKALLRYRLARYRLARHGLRNRLLRHRLPRYRLIHRLWHGLGCPLARPCKSGRPASAVRKRLLRQALLRYRLPRNGLARYRLPRKALLRNRLRQTLVKRLLLQLLHTPLTHPINTPDRLILGPADLVVSPVLRLPKVHRRATRLHAFSVCFELFLVSPCRQSHILFDSPSTLFRAR